MKVPQETFSNYILRKLGGEGSGGTGGVQVEKVGVLFLTTVVDKVILRNFIHVGGVKGEGGGWSR